MGGGGGGGEGVSLTHFTPYLSFSYIQQQVTAGFTLLVKVKYITFILFMDCNSWILIHHRVVSNSV